MPKPDAFRPTFEALKQLLIPYAKRFAVIVDKPDSYYLSTKESQTKSGSAIWFGGVQIKKDYVSYHLIPIYANQALLKTVSPALRKRMQGKSCFNFTEIKPAQLKELAKLTKAGTAAFVKTLT
ncbi:MAG TPA: hypothetical protein VGH34_17830 [Vicinamibacterales bacterium]|jgi:hypothetical protein